MALTIRAPEFRLIARQSDQLLWLLAGLMLAVLPHLLRTPLWVAVLFLALLGWRLSLPFEPGAKPRRRFSTQLTKFLIAVAAMTGVLISYGTLAGRDAGVALLILLAAMKMIEIRDERDLYVTSYIALFLLFTNFLYSQTMFSAAYMGVAVVGILGALISFNDPGRALSTRARLRAAGVLLLQALPLTLVLFLLFPRLPGPLWGLPKDAYAGLSGLDDEMSFGHISQLTLSNEVAFRVQFEGPMPERRSLYWRGPVLWFTDGVKWVADRPRSLGEQLKVSGSPVRYDLIMEATGKRWMYALELPVAAPEGSGITHDYQIRTGSAVRDRVRYQLTSHTDYRLIASGPEELVAGLQLPPGRHPRAVALGERWRESGGSDRQVVNRALAMFNEEPFYYTLSPPPVLDDSIDQFLFETRRGFCEHYAAAFVVLMRAAGVPARVVTGYQGGDINPIGNYLIVRQRDAHAWAEVWLGEQGWTRVDPTAAVAPARIEQGIDDALPESVIDIPLAFQDNPTARTFIQRARHFWDAVNNTWNQWVLGYDTNRQSLLLSRIGLGDLEWRGLIVFLLVAGGCVLLAIALWMLRSARTHADPARKAWDRFCRRLARRGIQRGPAEGPGDFGRRAARMRPDLREPILHISSRYAAVRYGGRPEQLEALRTAVSGFRPGPPPG